MKHLAAAVLILLCGTVQAADPKPTLLLEFSAAWCGPCRAMAPSVTALESEGIPVRRIDIDREPQLASAFSVDTIPCFVAVVDGNITGRRTGAALLNTLRQFVRKAGLKAKGK